MEKLHEKKCNLCQLGIFLIYIFCKKTIITIFEGRLKYKCKKNMLKYFSNIWTKKSSMPEQGERYPFCVRGRRQLCNCTTPLQFLSTIFPS